VLVGKKYRARGAGGDAAAEDRTDGIEVVDRKITFTTGEASITLDGPDITIEAKGRSRSSRRE